MGYLEKMLGNHEHVIIKGKRHLLFVILHMVPYVAGAIALWVAGGFALSRLDGTVRTVVSIGAFAISAYLIFNAAYKYLLWSREQYVITSERIIQIEGLARKRTFDSSLDQVNDIQMTQSIFGRIFNYGDIEIMTGSDVGVNQLWGITHPFEFKKAILDAKQQLRRAHFADANNVPSSATQANGTDAAHLLAALTDLRDSGVITREEYEQRRQTLLNPE